MKHKIIQVNNYLLAVVNDKKRGWFYCVRRKSFFHDEGEDVLCCNGDLSVEAHLPLNGANIIENLPLLPPLEQEDDVEEFVKGYIQELIDCKSVKEHERTWISAICHQAIIKAKEKYKYTEGDMRKALDLYKNTSIPLEGVIESLSQPKMPIAFKCETEQLGSQAEGYYEVPITSTNSQGQTMWVGKYIY